MPALEFRLRPEDAARLLRLPILARRAGRPSAVDRVWHDTADGALAADGLCLCEQAGMWRLEHARPAPGHLWPPGTPPGLVAEASDLAGLGLDLPGPLMPLAGLRGRQRLALTAEGDPPAEMTLLEGTLRGVTQERPICQLTLAGTTPQVLALSTAIGRAINLSAPLAGLASEALGLARGAAPAARRTGAPAIPPGTTLRDAITLVIGHLTDVILAAAPGAGAGATPEPVHQMRVAVRRLRSALSIFGRAAEPAAFEAVTLGLRQLAAELGAARDWDVFLGETGRAIAAAMPEEARITAMLEAGERRRVAAYQALGSYLDGPAFNALALSLVQLGGLQLWEPADAEQAARLNLPAEAYASAMFERRLEHMLAPGKTIDDLPIEELHRIRKAGKRLRYAAEFFAPLYGKRDVRRFVERLAVLQEALGHLNDTASAATLMASLGGGPARQFAAGAVQGFIAAQAGDTRRAIGQAWSKFRHQEAFWA